MTIHHLKEDIKRLARLAAGITDAYTAAIFLPTGSFMDSPIPTLLSAHRADSGRPRRESIELLGAHSLSSCLVRDCRIPVGAGLLGWVAENSRPIHLAPLDADNSSLGIYSDHEQIKALVAVPIPLPTEYTNGVTVCGVLMCDSRTAASFSKAHIKQLEELALHISRLVVFGSTRRDSVLPDSSWQSFTQRATQLSEAIGLESVEILRISIQNFPQLEAKIGMTAAIEAAEQFVRLMQQALPPHFPVIRIPSGEVLVALDNMMSAFFQQKFRSLAARPDRSDRSIVISMSTFSSKGLRLRGFEIDTIMKQGSIGVTTGSPITTTKTVAGGGTRA